MAKNNGKNKDKRKGHFLSLIPYEEVPRTPVKFPKSQARGDYQEPDYPNCNVPEKYRWWWAKQLSNIIKPDTQ